MSVRVVVESRPYSSPSSSSALASKARKSEHWRPSTDVDLQLRRRALLVGCHQRAAGSDHHQKIRERGQARLGARRIALAQQDARRRGGIDAALRQQAGNLRPTLPGQARGERRATRGGVKPQRWRGIRAAGVESEEIGGLEALGIGDADFIARLQREGGTAAARHHAALGERAGRRRRTGRQGRHGDGIHGRQSGSVSER
ncbi:MAG: hypothetical protein B7Z41_09810 [Rhizobiales bacterium 12-66-7]|nr:MAG: hypothetical protein B7Z41_09810 [Rhizobiales bacterium 12-66-7]